MNNSFYKTLATWPTNTIQQSISATTQQQVEYTLNRAQRSLPLSLENFMTLLSPAAVPFLKEMAYIAQQLTIQFFGKTIQLFTPLYISNFCINTCKYCGFSATNTINRTQLTIKEIEKEAQAIASTGLRHLLLLTGDAPSKATPHYLTHAVTCLKQFFPSIGIEVYAMNKEEYTLLRDAGVDGMTLFQETYNEKIYKNLHIKGPKKDFTFRLDAQSRAASVGIYSITIGALLGLDLWWRDIFYVGLHAAWLQKHYPSIELNISIPRIRPHEGSFSNHYPVTDQNLIQTIQAIRLFLPTVGITLSTREIPSFRDKLIALSITKMSAGVSTQVGGHTQETLTNTHTAQFEIADTRTVDQVVMAIKQQGYQPVFKNWTPLV